MNYIQRAWLVALRPVATFVNDKLAKKTGLIGRIGRFYAFGPRQYGFHPSNKLLAYVNSIIVQNMGLLFHKYSLVKSITMNGHTYLRSYRFLMYIGAASFFAAAFLYSVPQDYETEEGTTLAYIKDRLQASPINALQHRTSAHFTEINSLYLHEMTLKHLQKKQQILKNRATWSAADQKTRYAREGYSYIQDHSNFTKQKLD